MTSSSSTLLDFMSCERLDRDLFRGKSKDLRTGQVFGGQVLGQAIRAASHTIEPDRNIRSAHAYFLLKGDVDAPIIYEVDRSLDGGSISSRRVVAIQHGRQIFHLSASFQKEEKGLEYIPNIAVPFDLLESVISKGELNTQHYQSQFLDFHYLDDSQVNAPNAIQLWIKTKDKLPDDVETHNSILAYISDMGLLQSSLVPHDRHRIYDRDKRKLIIASIDHAIWYHQPFRADEWFFYDSRVIATDGGRGLSQGSLYNTDGTLFASTVQQGMIRVPRESK